MKKCVFVLGAGFSADVAGYPILEGLSENVSRSFQIAGLKMESIKGEIKIPGAILANVERLMSYLTQDHPWRKESDTYIYKAMYAELTTILSETFEGLERLKASDIAVNDDAKKLVKILHDQKAVVASFNYDILIEQLVLNMRGAAYFPFDIPIVNLYQTPMSHINSRGGAITYPESSDTFKLLKLHGSTNWYYSGSGYAGDQIYYRGPNDAEDQELVTKNKRGLKPFLIPPLLDKTTFYFSHAVQVQWRMFKEALLNAEYICFIGYSFPLSDTTIVSLFEEIVMSRGQIRGIALVKEKTEAAYSAVKERYLGIFGQKFEVENVEGKSVVRAAEWVSQ